MSKNILIIDDVKEQAEGLSKGLSKLLPEFSFENRYLENEIFEAIENRFYSLAIVDIRMDKYAFNGIEIVNRIIEVNPFAKVIIISAFKGEFMSQLKELFLTGKVLDIQDKEDLDIWLPKLKIEIENYFKEIENDTSSVNAALLQLYSESKNEVDAFKKGEKFEHFISFLFQSIGFKEISKRVKDKSLNEVDLIIRNDIDDNFINKFGKYILVECKNKPNDSVDKNDFIVFNEKLKNTNGLSELGIIATSGYITRNTYLEAIRGSGEARKILFFSNIEINQLINADNKLSKFKKLIDNQVKDN